VAVVAGVAAAAAGLAVAGAVSSGAAGGGSVPVTQVDPEVWSARTEGGGVRAQAVAATSLSGQVTTAGGVGVPGYRVEAFTRDGNFIADAVTDGRGRYAMSNVQLGPYRLKVSSVLPRPAQWAPRWSGNAVNFTSAAIVNLGQAPATWNVRLVPAATMTGRVLAGRVPQARVTVRRCGGSFLDCAATKTDARGFYLFAGVPADRQEFTMVDGSGRWATLVPQGAVAKLAAGKVTRINLGPVVAASAGKVTR
jgi:hypothetical protein